MILGITYLTNEKYIKGFTKEVKQKEINLTRGVKLVIMKIIKLFFRNSIIFHITGITRSVS